MIFNSVGSAFAGGAGQNTGGTSSQTETASESESNGDQTGSTVASDPTGASSASSGSSNGQTGGQSGASGQLASPKTATGAQTAAIPVDAAKAPINEDALRTQALDVQKRMNTDMLIRSLGSEVNTGLSLLSEAESETPVPLAVAAYAENFNEPVTDPAKAAA
tara:strand:+ start:545 stop:1033 length:489 start_codon:yes stop_codon:yes gene_type:complete